MIRSGGRLDLTEAWGIIDCPGRNTLTRRKQEMLSVVMAIVDGFKKKWNYHGRK